MRTFFKNMRPGEWLVRDEESGKVIYASEATQDWKGMIVDRRYADYEQPQDYLRPLSDPQTVPFHGASAPQLVVQTSTPTVIGRTSNPMPTNNAAYHLFTPDD